VHGWIIAGHGWNIAGHGWTIAGHGLTIAGHDLTIAVLPVHSWTAAVLRSLSYDALLLTCTLFALMLL
jgi:hypothetical protein